MITLDISVQVFQSDDLMRALLGEVATQLTAAFSRLRVQLKVRLDALIKDLIDKSPEADSLRGGRLRGQLGLVSPDDAISAIIAALQQAALIETEPVRVSGGAIMGGGISINLLKADFQEVLSIPQAAFTSQPSNLEVPWLNWLLTGGDSILVADYAFYPGAYIFSRTRQGIMRKPKGRSRFAPGWRIPEYQGTSNDNWLTRSFQNMLPTLDTIIGEELEKWA